MKIKFKLFLISLIICSLLMFFANILFIDEDKYVINSNICLNSKQDSPILINGNEGFLGYPGYGNETHPYIIENKIIDGEGSPCIKIKNIDIYFILRNCILFNGSNGIELENVTYGLIINNSANYNDIGINLTSSNNNSLCNNTANYNNHGIYLSYSSNNTLSNNIANFNNYIGFELLGIMSIIYSSLNFEEEFVINTLHDSSPNHNFIINNTANNNNYGIYLADSSNNTIIHNFINNNNYQGIYLRSANFNNISFNSANNNTEYGIYLWSSIFNIVIWNVLHDNLEGIYQIVAWGNIIENNDIINRFNDDKPIIIPGFSYNYVFFSFILFIFLLIVKKNNLKNELRLK